MCLGSQISLRYKARLLAVSRPDLGIMDLDLNGVGCERVRDKEDFVTTHASRLVGCFLDGELEVLRVWSSGETYLLVPVRDMEVLCCLAVSVGTYRLVFLHYADQIHAFPNVEIGQGWGSATG